MPAKSTVKPARKPRRAPAASDKRFKKIPGGGDHGTPERWQHSGRTLEPTDRAGILAVRATEEHILDILLLKNIIDAPQLDAALRFKADYHAASIASRVTGGYSGLSSARDFFRAEHERSDAEEAAYRRWRDALAHLDPRAGAVTVAIACHDMPPLPRDIPALRRGLQKLASTYGLAK